MARPVRLQKRRAQAASARLASHDVARGVLIGMSGTVLMLTVIAALYLAKSAAGINLMPGPSPLHDYLYHFIQ